MNPDETIRRFDAFLHGQELSLDAVVIGGTALGLLGVTTRHTRDCDILYPDLPQAIREAAVAFARKSGSEGDPLSDEWLNNGPASLIKDLPSGWQERLQPVFQGVAITLRSLGRLDFLRSKLFALCDRGTDLPDCIALAPSLPELAEIAPWLEDQDAHPGWPDHVRATLEDLRGRLGDGV